MENSAELESIRGVGHITADKLRQAGYDSFEKLAAASPEELKEKLGLNATMALNIISAAGETFKKAVPELPEEPEPLPVESAPAEVTLVESAPAEVTLVESAPAEVTPVESAPAEVTPVEAASDEATPVESAPAEVTPVESASDEAAPAEAPANEEPTSEEPAEAPTESSLMEGIISQVADGTATYALTDIVEKIATAIGNLPDISGKLLEEVMRNPASRTALVSKTAERLANLG